MMRRMFVAVPAPSAVAATLVGTRPVGSRAIG
jgi:hypothetical protein